MKEIVFGKKQKAMVMGAFLGAVVGYLITDLIIWKMLEKEFIEGMSELATDINPPEKSAYRWLGQNGTPVLEKKTTVDYSGFGEKGELEDLAQKYKSEDQPYVVTETEARAFQAEGAGVVLITYYEDDNTYCDENEELIEDPMSMLGPNPHLHFGEGSGDPDMVYIMNIRMWNVYEINRLQESYKIQVLGEIPEAPKSQKPKRMKRAANPIKPVEEPEAEEEAENATDSDTGKL